MSRVLLSIFITLPILLFSQDGRREPPVIGPSITYYDQAGKSVCIAFYTPRNERSGLYVNYGNTFMMKIDDKQKNWHTFIVRFRGTQPFSYKIISEDSRLNDAGGTVTPPAGKTYRFVIIGDTLDEKPASDYPVFNALARAATASRPSFFIHLGDIISVPNDLFEWSRFFEAGSILTRNAALMPALGNHDQFVPLYRKIFNLPEIRYSFYSYTLPRLRIIVCDSSLYFGPDSIQYRWLKQELAVPSLYKIVIMHIPPLSVNAIHTDAQNEAARKYLVPLFRQYGVNAVISGHEHLYERSVHDGIQYITSGGAAPMQDVTREENPDRRMLALDEPQYIEASVSASDLGFKVYNTNGNLLDFFHIQPDHP